MSGAARWPRPRDLSAHGGDLHRAGVPQGDHRLQERPQADARLAPRARALAETYRQLGMVADALRELELAATSSSRRASRRDAAGAAQDRRAAPGQHRVAHPAGRDGVAGRRRPTRRSTSFAAAGAAEVQGRADEYVRVAERLLFHRPTTSAWRASWRPPTSRARNPRLALAKLQAALKAAPRDPQNVTLLAEALAQLDPPKAVSVLARAGRDHDAAGGSTTRRRGARRAGARSDGRRDARDGRALGRSRRAGEAPRQRRRRRRRCRRQRGGARRAAGAEAARAGRRPRRCRRSGLSASASRAARPDAGPNEVGRILAQADVFVKYGLVERAADHLRRVFALDPRHRGARERLAGVLAQLGRRSEAAAELADPGRPARRGGRRRRAAGRGARADARFRLRGGGEAARARGGRAARARGGGRGAERRAAQRARAGRLLPAAVAAPTRRASVLDELAERFPGDPLIDEKRARHRGRAGALRRQGALMPSVGAPSPATRSQPTIPHGRWRS